MHTPNLLRPLGGLLLFVLLCQGAVACRKPAEPSELYTRAHTRFSKLYAEKGNEAFLDPAMSEIESQLQNVPAESLDAQAAKELIARIAQGRSAIEAERKARNEAVARAGEAPSVNFGSTPSSPDPVPQPSGVQVPSIGTPVSELQTGFSSCFQKQKEQVNVMGRGLRDVWELSTRPECRQEYASVQDTLFIIEEDKVQNMAPRSNLREMPAEGNKPAPAAGSTGSTP
jgi:hypothetical protein